MMEVLALLVLLGALGVAAYYRLSAKKWLSLLAVILVVFSFILPAAMSVILWVIWGIATTLLAIYPLRRQLFIQPFLVWFKKQLPPLTAAEKEALEAGGTWWEAEFFSGEPDWQRLLQLPTVNLRPDEQRFIEQQVNVLCQQIDDWEITESGQLPDALWQFILEERFLGLTIPKTYEGWGFSAHAHSAIITKIASRSVSAAISVMVPNSVGAAEFIERYGTEVQKHYYLPRLAQGLEIPCFALTAPEAGSDASNIKDNGTVCYGEYEGKRVLGIRLNWNKRYITLGPIATLMGIAVKLYDPDHLLGQKNYLGITFCLVPGNLPGVQRGYRHQPTHMGFINGPIRGENVFIPIDNIIGGREACGQGWNMMMECLAVGRGISLPALATATAKICYRMSGAYAKIRQQFKRSIGDFEGVQLALARIGGLTYLCEATRLLTLIAIDQDIRPSVATAIAKYHLTEMGRQIINDALDIHAGRGVQNGPRNYLLNLYTAAPINITVEGANILTRSLIIFGQGVMRCHPYLIPELDAAGGADSPQKLKQFDRLLLSHLGFASQKMVRALVYGITQGSFIAVPHLSPALKKYYQQLTRMSNALAFATDWSLAVLGNQLKFKEAISSRLGDVLSFLYMGSAVLKYYQDYGDKDQDLAHVTWALDYCLYRIGLAFDQVFTNFPKPWLGKVLKRIIFPWGNPYSGPVDKNSFAIAEQMQQSSALRDRLTRGCYIGTDDQDILGRMDNALNSLTNVSAVLNKLVQAIKSGKIAAKQSREEQIKEAAALGIISDKEADHLRQVAAICWDVIQVDEFAFSPTQHKEAYYGRTQQISATD